MRLIGSFLLAIAAELPMNSPKSEQAAYHTTHQRPNRADNGRRGCRHVRQRR